MTVDGILVDFEDWISKLVRLTPHFTTSSNCSYNSTSLIYILYLVYRCRVWRTWAVHERIDSEVVRVSVLVFARNEHFKFAVVTETSAVSVNPLGYDDIFLIGKQAVGQIATKKILVPQREKFCLSWKNVTFRTCEGPQGLSRIW